MMLPPEPEIIINGTTLSEAEAVTVRIAIEILAMTVDAGEPYGRNHRMRIESIRQLISKQPTL